MTDKIVLKNMMFFGYHGVYEVEQEIGQRFYIDAELYGDFSKAGVSDQLSDALDYVLIYSEIKAICEGKRFHLLEALAQCIANELLTHQVAKVCVRVRKPGVPLPGFLDFVEVETTVAKKV
jgi:dihydroneopterin aldolase